MKKSIYITMFFLLSIALAACSEDTTDNGIDTRKAKVRMLELGSTSCDDCIRMQPVLDSIRTKYGSQIDVIFIDLIKNFSYVDKYKVEVMPTQVFLDSNDTEIHRHIGFYSEDSIHIYLRSIGLIKLN